MKVAQNENVASTANRQMDAPVADSANSMAPPEFSLTAEPVVANQTAQLQTNEEDNDPGEAITDAATYYVCKDDATIRKNDNPGSFTSNEIPAGTKMKRVRTFNNGAVAQLEVLEAAPGSSTTVGTKYWTTFSNVQASETVSDNGSYFVSYSDTWLYGGPYGAIQTTVADGQTSNQNLEASKETGYTIVERCGAFVKVKEGDTDKGWIMEGALMNQTTRDRSQYMDDMVTWLDARYAEVQALAGDAKTARLKGILSLMESVAHQLENGTFPVIADLSTTPTFEAHSYTSFMPPELTLAVRRFIVALEAGEPAAEAETEAETPATETTAENADGAAVTADDGSDYDWNARLGVPQYRTQSDNLAPPEVTCGPTSFTMGAERLGYGRADMIEAIDDKLRESLAADASQSDVEDKFEEKAEEFLKSFKSASNNYQKLRGNNGGLANDEDDLAEGFREWGQYEDLTYFLAWLNNIGRGSVASPSSQTMLDSLHDASTGTDNGAGDNSEVISFSGGKEFTLEHRQKIQDTLAAGGAVILSLYHKGTQSGTHITTVRSVTAEGLAMDDPYGQVNPEYRHGVSGDAFKDKGGSGGRSSYNWRNVPHYDASEDDYSERDFTRAAAEELDADEMRGQNEVLTWAMIEESTNLLNYLRFYTRR